jgi:DNA replication protein DnaC
MNAATPNPTRQLLLKHNLKALRLPTMLSEHEKLAREAADANEDYHGYLLRLSELEVASRSSNAIASRIKQAGFPVSKEIADFDFTLTPSLSKPRVLSRSDWIDRHDTACLLGNSGTGKTHLAIAIGLCAARAGKRVKFNTAALLANHLEETQKKYQLERVLKSLERIDLLIIDELGYLSFSRTAAELLFQVFADRYERRSILVTSNLPFDEWATVFQGERMTAALLDRFTHRCTILEMNGESYRFRESTGSTSKRAIGKERPRDRQPTEAAKASALMPKA